LKKALFVLLLVFGILWGLSNSPVVPLKPEPNPRPIPDSTNPILRIDVFYVPESKVMSMDLEQYVKGVVASEMPASFHLEALKAQAVVARTYAVRKMRIFGGIPSRPDADVTSDSKIDQAWNPETLIKERWGLIKTWLNWPKVERAVQETKGLILTYNGRPAEAVYHSTCGGRTEAAKDVWGKDIPYLQSVRCSYCRHSPYYNAETVTFSTRELSHLLGLIGLSVPASKVSQDGIISVSAISPTGRIKELIVNGKRVRGIDFRSALNLRSTRFSWTVSGDNVVFRVRGYGHGVGMCQYGADGLAKRGESYLDILSYYYPGTSLTHIFEE